MKIVAFIFCNERMCSIMLTDPLISQEGLNFHSLMDLQEPIFKKYEDYEILHNPIYSKEDPAVLKNFLARLDQYYICLVEEIQESIEVYQKFNKKYLTIFERMDKDDGNRLIEELCDVILYASTIGSIARYKLLVRKNFSLDEDNSAKICNFEEWVIKCIDEVGKSRRIFPERKWHKPSPAVTIQEIDSRLISVICKMKLISEYTAQFSYRVYNECDKKSNDPLTILSNKSQYINELPLII